MPIDLPETRMLERGLREFDLDAVTALAVLLKTLGDDHLARVPRLDPIDPFADGFDPDDEAHARTPLEKVHFVLKRECRKNGELAARHDPSGTTPAADAALPSAARIAGDLMMVQDALRDIVGGYADLMDVYESALQARDAPPEPGVKGAL